MISPQTPRTATSGQPEVSLVAVTGGLPLGGSSTFLLNLSKALKRKGHVFPVIVLAPTTAYADEFAAINNPLVCLPHSKLIYEDRLRFGYDTVARYRPRAVLSCMGTESFEVLRSIPAGVARFGIVQSHDPGPYEAARLYSRWINVMIGVSTEICRHLSNLPEFSKTRVEYIPYGIEFGAAPLPRSFDPAQPLRVVYVGRLVEEQKRVSRLVELVRRLRAANANVEFTFVGSGSAEAEMRRDLASFSFVHFAGALPYEQVAATLATQDVFVLLSDYEGLPLGLLEAMGQGLVPVVSDLPSGIRDVVDDTRGVRVPVGDLQAATDALLALARDRSKLRERGSAAMSFARENYNADLMAERYLHLVNAIGQKTASWPQNVTISVPLAMKRPWLFRGIMRMLRRHLKRVLS